MEDGYTAFCESLNSALQAMAQEMEARPEDDTLADAAIHFALISYAAGLPAPLCLLAAGKTGRRNGPSKQKRKGARLIYAGLCHHYRQLL